MLLRILTAENVDNQIIIPFTKEQELCYHIKSDNVEIMHKAIQEGIDIDNKVEGEYIIVHVGQNKAYQVFELLLQHNVNMDNARYYTYYFVKNPIFLKLLKKYDRLNWVLSNQYVKQEIEQDELLSSIINED